MDRDPARLAAAVTRQVADREHDGKPARVVVVARDYDTTVEDLWDALTNPERIPRWFLPVDGDLKLGGRYQFKGNAGGVITACVPPHELGATWEMGPQISWVTVRLSATGSGARLELEHTAPVGDDSSFWDQYGPGAVGVGWDLALASGLAMHVATGAAVDPAEALAWSASEAGKKFIRLSSDAWGQASAAFGTDPDQALASAERTRQFYTGDPPA